MQGEMWTRYISSLGCSKSTETVLEFNHFMVDKAAHTTIRGGESTV